MKTKALLLATAVAASMLVAAPVFAADESNRVDISGIAVLGAGYDGNCAKMTMAQTDIDIVGQTIAVKQEVDQVDGISWPVEVVIYSLAKEEADEIKRFKSEEIARLDISGDVAGWPIIIDGGTDGIIKDYGRLYPDGDG